MEQLQKHYIGAVRILSFLYCSQHTVYLCTRAQMTRPNLPKYQLLSSSLHTATNTEGGRDMEIRQTKRTVIVKFTIVLYVCSVASQFYVSPLPQLAS
jgi:hypothetical protein